MIWEPCYNSLCCWKLTSTLSNSREIHPNPHYFLLHLLDLPAATWSPHLPTQIQPHQWNAQVPSQTYCKEVHDRVSSLSKQRLTESDTKEWAWINWNKTEKNRSDGNLHTQIVQNQTQISCPHLNVVSSSWRRDWEDWSLKSKRPEGFNIIMTSHVSWLLTHHSRNKNNYVESLQVPHCRTELSDLGPDGKDDLSKCFLEMASIFAQPSCCSPLQHHQSFSSVADTWHSSDNPDYFISCFHYFVRVWQTPQGYIKNNLKDIYGMSAM